MGIALPVDSIAETAYVTAYARAVESERADALFFDPHAQELAGSHGRAAMQRMPGPEFTIAGCVMRTLAFDQLICDVLNDSAIDAVLNLGAGLDARPFRLPLPPNLRWIDIDSAPVLAYKESKLRGHRPRCRWELIPVDIADGAARRKALDQLAAHSSRVLVVSEGLLAYMSPEQVSALAEDLHDCEGIVAWATDLVSAEAMRMMQELLGVRSSGPVRLVFAPPDGPSFFRRYGWQASEYRSCFEEGRKWRRWLVEETWVELLSDDHRAKLRQLLGVALLTPVAR